MPAKFQRRHYEAIAECVSAVRDDRQSPLFDTETAALNGVVYRMADLFARDNPAFDRARFLFACGIATDDTTNR